MRVCGPLSLVQTGIAYELPIETGAVLRPHDLVAWSDKQRGRVKRYTRASAPHGHGRGRYPRDPTPSLYVGVCVRGGIGTTLRSPAMALVSISGSAHARCAGPLDTYCYVRPSPKGFVRAASFFRADGFLLQMPQHGVGVVWLFPPHPDGRPHRRRATIFIRSPAKHRS